MKQDSRSMHRSMCVEAIRWRGPLCNITQACNDLFELRQNRTQNRRCCIQVSSCTTTKGELKIVRDVADTLEVLQKAITSL